MKERHKQHRLETPAYSAAYQYTRVKFMPNWYQVES